MVGATRGRLLTLLVAVACASAGPRQAGTPAAATGVATESHAAFELAAGVVIDPTAKAVYLARPGGGIEALEPATGEPRWLSVETARPLAARGGRLLAQRETGRGLPLAILDASDGALLRRLEAPLPEGVTAAVDETLERRFRVSPRGRGGPVLLEWEYLERDPVGVSPPGGRPWARRELGALRLDLETGQAVAVGGAGGDPLPPPVERLLAAGELRTPPWRVGELLAAVEQRHEAGRSPLVLRRWRAETGEPLPEVTLRQERPVAVLAAADRRHLLLVSPAPEVAGEAGPYRWSIHDLATGEAVASHRAEISAMPFCLLAGRLLHVSPPSGRRVDGAWRQQPHRLRAVDPGSGVELWQRPVRDPAFRGPVPPRP